MYRPYMSASALSEVVDKHEKLAAKGHFLHDHIRSNIAPVLQTRTLKVKPVNRWNPGSVEMSALKRTTGNIFFDYVSGRVCPLVDVHGWRPQLVVMTWTQCVPGSM